MDSLAGSLVDMAEKRITDLNDILIEISQTEKAKTNMTETNAESYLGTVGTPHTVGLLAEESKEQKKFLKTQ